VFAGDERTEEVGRLVNSPPGKRQRI
jgi:hypothetical protein